MSLSFFMGSRARVKGSPDVGVNDRHVMCIYGQLEGRLSLLETHYDDDPNQLMRELVEYARSSPYADGNPPEPLNGQPATEDSIFLRGHYVALAPGNYERVRQWIRANAGKFKIEE